jgi:hypothetical protein
MHGNMNVILVIWLFKVTASYFQVTPADFNETAFKIHFTFQVRNYIFYTPHIVAQHLSKSEAF